MGFYIVGAVCERCGLKDADGVVTDTYLERHNGDRFVTLCKNAADCADRQRAVTTPDRG